MEFLDKKEYLRTTVSNQENGSHLYFFSTANSHFRVYDMYVLNSVSFPRDAEGQICGGLLLDMLQYCYITWCLDGVLTVSFLILFFLRFASNTGISVIDIRQWMPFRLKCTICTHLFLGLPGTGKTGNLDVQTQVKFWSFKSLRFVGCFCVLLTSIVNFELVNWKWNVVTAVMKF